MEKPPVSESGASQAHVEAFRAGFPSLKALKHSAVLGVHGVNVHGTESRNRSVVVSVHEDPGTARAPVERELLSGDDGKRVYVNWPFLREAKVIGVSDKEGRTEIVSLLVVIGAVSNMATATTSDDWSCTHCTYASPGPWVYVEEQGRAYRGDLLEEARCAVWRG